MPDNHSITQEGFDSLLGWLAADGEAAGKTYEAIRRRLIKLFVTRGCHEPELLADRTIDRVISKVPQISSDYIGEPVLYFYGVANKVHQEWLRNQKHERDAVFIDPNVDPNAEVELSCLQDCLKQLRPKSRDLILEYYREEKAARVQRRKDLAQDLGVSLQALQNKASRIRVRLSTCVAKCVERKKK